MAKKKQSKNTDRYAHLRLLNQVRSTIWKENKGNYGSYREFLKDKDVTGTYTDIKFLGRTPDKAEITENYYERKGEPSGVPFVPDTISDFDEPFWAYEDLPLSLLPSNIWIKADSVTSIDRPIRIREFSFNDLADYCTYCNGIKPEKWSTSDDAPRLKFSRLYKNSEGNYQIEIYGLNPLTNQRDNYGFKIDMGPDDVGFPEEELPDDFPPPQAQAIREDPQVAQARKEKDLDFIRLERINNELTVIEKKIDNLIAQVKKLKAAKLSTAAKTVEKDIAALIIKQSDLLSQI